MKSVSIIVGLLLAAGIAAGAWLLRTSAPEPAPAAHFDSAAATEDRLLALERAIAEERDARQLLEEELQALYAEIERLDQRTESSQASATGVEGGELEEARRRMALARNDPDERRQILIDGGFSPDRAEWLARRESELQMEAMQARFDARRSGEPFDPFEPGMNPGAALRAEIGDVEYEQYLEASGRPTSIQVGTVLESSPGQRAGLQPGDEIIRYDGERVFNFLELSERTMLGEPGESIVIDVMRDGILMQVVVPRGPIGVTAGRSFRGRRGG